jgi:glycine/D-amino acid oxidase-like deaminating enzyme
MTSLSDAEFVIIGGGAVGCGVAYSLAQAGKTDVLLLERAATVGQVTTAQGAGLCGQVRTTVERTRLAMHSVATFRKLQSDPDVRPDWHEVGSLRIALSDERVSEFRQLHAVAEQAGLETAFLEPNEAKGRWPLIDFSKAKAVLWCPSDGYMTPLAVAKSYEHQSRKIGVRFATDTAVQAIHLKNGRVDEVLTNHGRARCKYVINSAGAHAYHIAKMVGLELPIVPVRHEYFVTASIEGLTPDLPCFRIPEMSLYGRVRDGGLLLGGWESKSQDADPRSYSSDESPPSIEPDWHVLSSFEHRFKVLFPQLHATEKSCVGKGWPTFTPDGRFILGESRSVPGFVMAGGCNAHGISGSAGIGSLLVQALFDSNPSNYVRSLSPDRFTDSRWTWEEARRQASQIYESYYGVNC